MDMSIDNRMQSHGVRPTAVRNLILSVLDNATHPISALDIETSLDTVDRSSITRALSLFVEKGLIHIIDDGSSSAKYEVCRATHTHTGNDAGFPSHEDLHVHFRCTGCGKTYCLPSITLPSGFIPATANYIITGTCPDCRPR